MAKHIFYADCPFTALTAIEGASLQSGEGIVIIPPGGKARGTISIPDAMCGVPLTPLTRSHWAQLGMHVVRDTRQYIHDEREERRNLYHVTIHNWSSAYALMVQEDDSVTLATLERIRGLVLTASIPLTAAGVSLQVQQHLLPQYHGITCAGSATFASWKTYMIAIPRDVVQIDPGEFVALPVEPLAYMGLHEIGILRCTIPGLCHTSSFLVYPKSSGMLVMEMKSFAGDGIRIHPGMRLGMLDVYRLA